MNLQPDIFPTPSLFSYTLSRLVCWLLTFYACQCIFFFFLNYTLSLFLTILYSVQWKIIISTCHLPNYCIIPYHAPFPNLFFITHSQTAINSAHMCMDVMPPTGSLETYQWPPILTKCDSLSSYSYQLAGAAQYGVCIGEHLWSCVGKHSCSEFMSAMDMSYPQDTISQHYSSPGSYILFLSPYLQCSLSFEEQGRRVDIDVPFRVEDSLSYSKHFDKVWSVHFAHCKQKLLWPNLGETHTYKHKLRKQFDNVCDVFLDSDYIGEC